MPKEATKEELKAQMRRRSKGQAERPQVQKRLPPEEIYSLFKDVTSGLAYLHASNYIHRDLKLSNCLLHRDGNKLKCLISDFGEVQPGDAVRKSTGSTGTISYCGPEVLKKDASSVLRQLHHQVGYLLPRHDPLLHVLWASAVRQRKHRARGAGGYRPVAR
ncbi:hypothetical protein VTK26DRAFT_2360 [Humicola hyalothermophila]